METPTQECLQPSLRFEALGAVFVLVERFLLCGFLCHFETRVSDCEKP